MTNANANTPQAASVYDAASAKERFFDSGIQYYVAARYAAFAHLAPVCGNLFHHAVEMFIKGGLARLGLAALKRLGHALPGQWKAFKDGDAALDRFDTVIAELDRFDLIRYPDRVLADGMQSFIELDAPKPGVPPSTSTMKEPVYRLSVEEIDSLVKAIFDKASVNPPFFTNRFNADARAYLERSPKAQI
jgi:hypothetical protein